MTTEAGAYYERNIVVAALTLHYPAGTRKTEIIGWDPAWHNCVYLDLPTGQVSFHYHDSEVSLFAHLPPYTLPWDGHDKRKVLSRLRHLVPGG